MTDKRIKDAAQVQDNIERAEAIGTPYGLRSLFPTNLVTTRTRQIQASEIQRRRIIMKQHTKREDAAQREEQDRTAPTGTAQAADHLMRDGEGTRGQPVGTESQENGDTQDAAGGQPRANPSPAIRGGAGGPQNPSAGQSPLPPILPQPTTPPGPNEKQDPGPPPQIPQYSGPASPVTDQLLMAATARDVDALRAIPTRNEPPQVGQYKANLMQWLEDYENHGRNSEALRHAQARTNPDD